MPFSSRYEGTISGADQELRQKQYLSRRTAIKHGITTISEPRAANTPRRMSAQLIHGILQERLESVNHDGTLSAVVANKNHILSESILEVLIVYL